MMYGLAWHCGDDTDEYNGEPHYPRRGRAAATGSVAHGIHVESSIVPALHYSILRALFGDNWAWWLGLRWSLNSRSIGKIDMLYVMRSTKTSETIETWRRASEPSAIFFFSSSMSVLCSLDQHERPFADPKIDAMS